MHVGSTTIESARDFVFAHPVKDHSVPVSFQVEVGVLLLGGDGARGQLEDVAIVWGGRVVQSAGRVTEE